jgi:hypothetical protein
VWALDRLANVWDHTITPTSDLVPEDSQRSGQATADGAFGHDSAQWTVFIRYWRHFNHELSPGTLTRSAEW